MDHTRLGNSKLNKEHLLELVLQPKSSRDLRLKGFPSYRILRCSISEQFNYVNPEIKGQRQTDFVISPYKKPEYKLCSLDLVNCVTYLAYLDPDDAMKLEFGTEYLYSHRLEMQRKEDIDDLESIMSESDLGDFADSPLAQK